MNMRIGKLLIAIVFASLALVLISSLVMAAPARGNQLNDDPEPTITSTVVTETKVFTQPVAWAISFFFDISYTQVISWHDSGLGFGVIARAAMMTRLLSDTGTVSPTLTLEDVLTQFQSGMGWGQFKKKYDVPLGGNGLGAIMRASENKLNKPDCPGNSCKAPGLLNKPDKGNGPNPEVTRGPKK